MAVKNMSLAAAKYFDMKHLENNFKTFDLNIIKMN